LELEEILVTLRPILKFIQLLADLGMHFWMNSAYGIKKYKIYCLIFISKNTKTLFESL